MENVNKIVPWSFSKAKAFETCPKQFYHVKILKEHPEVETDAMRYGSLMHEAAEKYIRDKEPLPEGFKYIQSTLDALASFRGEKLCEFKMGLTDRLEPCGFFAENVWWRGIADLVILDTEKHRARVIDYKSGKSARYADKGQLELMALAIFAHFPVVQEVKAGLLFVVCNQFIRDKYSRKDQSWLWDKWMNTYTRMASAVETEVWNANPSGLCRNHCPVTECIHNGRN